MLIVEALQAALCCVASLPGMPSPRTYTHPSPTTDTDTDTATDTATAMDIEQEDAGRRGHELPRYHHDQRMEMGWKVPAGGISHVSTENTYVMQYLTPSHRLQLFTRLTEQLEAYSTTLLLYRKQARDAEKLRGKKGSSGSGGSGGRGDRGERGTETGGGHDTPPSTGLTPLGLPKQLGGYQSPEAVNVHAVEVELELCVFGLDELFMKKRGLDEDEEEDEDERSDQAEREGGGETARRDRHGLLLGDQETQAETEAEAEAEAASVALRRSSSSPFLRKHLLERALYCLEVTLKLLHVQRFASRTDTETHTSTESDSDRDRDRDSSYKFTACDATLLDVIHRKTDSQGQGQGHTTSHHRIMAQCHHLFQCLMRVLIKLRSEDKESACEMGTQHQKTFHTANNSNIAVTTASGTSSSAVSSPAVGSLVFPVLSQHQYLYPNQLVLRCMLGCLRAESIYSFHLSQAILCTASASNTEGGTCHAGQQGGGGDELAKDVDKEKSLRVNRAQFRIEHLTALLEEGFKVGHSGRRRGVLSEDFQHHELALTIGSGITGLTWGGATGTLRETESRLEKQVS